MRPHIARLYLAAALALHLSPPLAAEEPVEVLRAQVDELKTDLDRPIDDFNQLYEKQLIALKEQAQQSGDLDLALAATTEVTTYKTGGSTPATDEKLKRLQEIYASESARLKKERAQKHIELLKGYRQRLEAATTELTKAGDLEGALAYRNEVVATESQITELSASVATAPTQAPEKAPEPKKEEGPEFVAGVYQMGEGFGPTIIFYENGKYDAKFFGSGRWKSKGSGRMELNSSDEFNYVPGRDVWIGTINLGGEREVVLKYAGGGEGGKGRDGESTGGDKGRPDQGEGRRPFPPRGRDGDRRDRE